MIPSIVTSPIFETSSSPSMKANKSIKKSTFNKSMDSLSIASSSSSNSSSSKFSSKKSTSNTLVLLVLYFIPP